jgi:hypothetical protein
MIDRTRLESNPLFKSSIKCIDGSVKRHEVNGTRRASPPDKLFIKVFSH